MKSQTVKQVIDRFFHSAYPSGVTRQVQHWLIEADKQPEKESALQEIWEQLETGREMAFSYSWESVRNKAGLRSLPFRRNVGISRRLAAVLVPVLIAVGGYFCFFRQPEMTGVATLNNEQKYFRLPDNSEVWLNSGSQLRYPAVFSDTVRRIYLTGEACFRVHPDSLKPFIVQTADMAVRALGTEFNVYAYSSDSRSVATLNHGKIQVDVMKTAGDCRSYVLVPGQQVVFYKEEGKAAVETVGGEVPGWKEGQLIFRDAALPDIINIIRRHYDVEIDYRQTDFPADLYSVRFINNESLSRVMEVLQEMAGFRCIKSGAKKYRLVRAD